MSFFLFLNKSIYSKGSSDINHLTIIMKNKIYHQSHMQTEKSQSEGKWIMLETRFTELPALSLDPRVGISHSALESMFDYFSYL